MSWNNSKSRMTMNHQSYTNANAQGVSINQSLRRYMMSVYKNMGIGLLITALISFFAANNPSIMRLMYGSGFGMLVVFATIGLAFYMGSLQMRIISTTLSKIRSVFLIYSSLMGLSMSYVFFAYTRESIHNVFLVTAATFGCMSIYGYSTKKDLTSFGSFFLMGVLGIFLASIVNIFLQSSMLSFVTSCIGVIAFTGLIAYDTQKIKDMFYAAGSSSANQTEKLAVCGAFVLYLDVINLFSMLLRLFGDRR